MPTEKSFEEVRLLAEQQQFLHSALHDIRASQRGVAMAAQLLLAESSVDTQTEGFAKQVLAGLSKTEELLDLIGKYAICLNPNHYTFSCFPAASAVRFAMANLEEEIRSTGATVLLGVLPEIHGDRQRLADLFEQLLSNSLKFQGEDPPQVKIGAQRTPEGWLFSITDNGIGIPLKYRDRLFIPFKRLHGPDVPGAGLGLAIGRKIVEVHGGHLSIDGPEAGGVTFNVLLPSIDGI